MMRRDGCHRSALIIAFSCTDARGSGMRSVAAVILGSVLAFAACQVGPGEDVTTRKPYSDFIGARYIVVGDLYAYGVSESRDKALNYVILVPPPGVGGPEFPFRRTVRKGQVIKILSAWHQFVLWEKGIYYLVAVENSELPPGIPVRLELMRGNEGVGADLNTAIYRRLPRDN